MTNYFKDKKFLLAYLDVENGIPISYIPRLLEDDKTMKSLVIAARASPVSVESYMGAGYSMDVRFTAAKDPVKKKFKDIFDHFCSLSNSDRTDFLALNADISEELTYRMSSMEDITVNRLLILALDNGEPIEDDSKIEWACNKVKHGGPELVVDFLLSSFCRNATWEWVRRDDPSVKYVPENDLLFFGPSEEEGKHYKEIPVYDFSNKSTLDDLIEYEEEFDDEGFGYYKASNIFYYYSVNLKAISKLVDMISIPYRVEKILTDEQKEKLNSEVPKILMDELDYIARSVLLQKVDSYVDDRARQYDRMRSQQWASDMYDVLGGDGDGNVYMSEGMSITPDGRIVED